MRQLDKKETGIDTGSVLSWHGIKSIKANKYQDQIIFVIHSILRASLILNMWAIATIPAIIILTAVGAITLGILNAILGGVHHRMML